MYNKKGFDYAYAFCKLDLGSNLNDLAFAEESKHITDIALQRSSVIIFDIKAYDLKKEKICNFGFSVLPLANKLNDQLYLSSGCYRLPLFKGGPVPRKLLQKIE